MVRGVFFMHKIKGGLIISLLNIVMFYIECFRALFNRYCCLKCYLLFNRNWNKFLFYNIRVRALFQAICNIK